MADTPQRTCLLWYKDPKHSCVCAVNPVQATTVLGVLDQDRRNRIDCAFKLNNVLSSLRKQGQLDHRAKIAVSRKTQGGLTVACDSTLYWRICVWLMFSLCLEGSPRIYVMSRLRDFISGVDVKSIDFSDTFLKT